MINIEELLKIGESKIKISTKTGKIIRKKFNDRRKAKKDELGKSIVEDIQQNRNHTWIEEIYSRNKNTLDDPALFYRGTEVTYKEMFVKMREYAKALKVLGVEKGTEIPICMSNTPELVYILGAISLIGAKANIFNEEFDPDYITEIIDGCNGQFMFVEDRKYPILKDSIANVAYISVTLILNSSLATNKKLSYFLMLDLRQSNIPLALPK